jgi:hypothetical protein
MRRLALYAQCYVEIIRWRAEWRVRVLDAAGIVAAQAASDKLKVAVLQVVEIMRAMK